MNWLCQDCLSEDLGDWIAELKESDLPSAPLIHQSLEVIPLAIELMEMYGEVTHGGWLRFLDEEILDVLPEDERGIIGYIGGLRDCPFHGTCWPKSADTTVARPLHLWSVDCCLS